jgi:hypothetical protein
MSIKDVNNVEYFRAEGGGVKVGGDLQVNGGDIGISTDTDLIKLASNQLTIKGKPIVNILSTSVSGSNIAYFENEGGVIAIGSGTPSHNPTYGNYISGRNSDNTAYAPIGLKTNVGVPQFILDTSGNASIAGALNVLGMGSRVLSYGIVQVNTAYIIPTGTWYARISTNGMIQVNSGSGWVDFEGGNISSVNVDIHGSYVVSDGTNMRFLGKWSWAEWALVSLH